MKRIYGLLLFLLLIPFVVDAYTTDQYYIEAELQKNGDLVVEEYYTLNGEYNGSRNTICFKNSSYDYNSSVSIAGFSNIYDGDAIVVNEVKSVGPIKDFDFSKLSGTKFSNVTYASVGDVGKYTEDYIYGCDKLMIYMPSNLELGFYIKYTITNAAVLHNDVGELWWKRFDAANMDESIRDFRIKIHLPGNNDEFKVWAHGPLNGEVRKNGLDEYYAYINGMDSNQDISFRMTFDKSVISNSPKKSNIDGLPSILAYEEDSAAEANYQREMYLKELEDEYLTLNTSCMNYASHSCYDRLAELRGLIGDEDFLKKYEANFEYITKSLLENDRTNALNAVAYAKETLKYSDYLNAVELVNILADEDTKLYNKELIELNYIENLIRDAENTRVKNIYTVMAVVTSLVAAGFVLMKIYYKNLYKKYFDHDYYREIPDISVTSASYLMKDKVNSNTVSANILELVNKDIITIKPLDKMNYEFSIDPELKKGLQTHGKMRNLIDLIFAGKTTIDLKEIKKYSHRDTYSYLLSNAYEDYQLNAKREFLRDGYLSKKDLFKDGKLAKAQTILGILSFFLPVIFLLPFICVSIYKYFVSHTKLSTFKTIEFIGCLVAGILCIVLPVYVSFINGFIKVDPMVPFNAVIGILVILAFTACQKVYSEKGYEYIGKLNGLKRFLNDFSIIDERELPEMTLWGNFMVFALLFGIADKVAKVMQLRLDSLPNPVYYDFNMYSNFDYIGRNVYNTGTTAHNIETRAQAAASSGGWSSGGGGWSGGSGSFSSGGGGGGGFSSHSSGGGGGGGSGRF